MKKREWMVIAITALLVASMLLPKAPAQVSGYDTIQVRTIQRKIEAVGTVAHEYIYPVPPLSAGSLRLFVEKGDFVSGGQALFEIENLPIQSLDAELLKGANAEPEQAALGLYKANTMLSPKAGKVVSLNACTGMAVAAGVPVLSIASKEMVVNFLLPEAKREDVYEGQAVRVTRGGNEVGATISEIVQADAPGQFSITAALPATAFVSPGMQVDVSIVTDSITAPSVPMQAVSEGCVTCLVDSRPVRANVKTGLNDEMFISLLYGPAVGTKVLAEGGGRP